MTDRELLLAIPTTQFGLCEEESLPRILALIRGHLAGDPDAERYLIMHRPGFAYIQTFARDFEKKYSVDWAWQDPIQEQSR